MIPWISTSVAEGIVNEETISVNDKLTKNGPWVEEIHPEYIFENTKINKIIKHILSL